jgi:hypothetical protein
MAQASDRFIIEATGIGDPGSFSSTMQSVVMNGRADNPSVHREDNAEELEV